MTKSAEHNSKLCAEAVAKSGVHSRFPRVSEQAECLPLGLESLPPFAYNPSVLRIQSKLWMTYRYHFAGDYRTRLGIAQIGEGGKVVKSADLPIEGNSVEDARLFSYHCEIWIAWIESNFIGQKDPKCVVKYAQLESPVDHREPDEKIRLEQAQKVFKINRVFQIKAGGNDMTCMQKNWCFFESDENLFVIFESWPEQVIWHVQGETVINEHRTKCIKWPYGVVRGGSVVPFGDKLLRFFHSSTDYGIGRPEKRYYIGAILMGNKPPFESTSISRKPVLYGSEVDSMKSTERKACRHWKENVVFPCGTINFGKDFLIAAGINDAACALVKITEGMLNL